MCVDTSPISTGESSRSGLRWLVCRADRQAPVCCVRCADMCLVPGETGTLQLIVCPQYGEKKAVHRLVEWHAECAGGERVTLMTTMAVGTWVIGLCSPGVDMQKLMLLKPHRMYRGNTARMSCELRVTSKESQVDFCCLWQGAREAKFVSMTCKLPEGIRRLVPTLGCALPPGDDEVQAGYSGIRFLREAAGAPVMPVRACP